MPNMNNLDRRCHLAPALGAARAPESARDVVEAVRR
jgi:hypothetical protein